MYNEKIEMLINAALADGVLTEKEKQILFKRAQEQGIDLDEFEMVLDARLIELQKAEKEKAESSAPKSNKFGDVRKCPVCGALVPALSGICGECGYEFTGIEANSSSKLLAKKIEEITEAQSKKAAPLKDELVKKEGKNTDELKDRIWEIMTKERVMAIAQAVKSFPIPNTKADLFEFIMTMQSNMLSPSLNKLEAEAYFIKYHEAILKVRALFKNDLTMSDLLKNHDSVIADFKIVHRKHKRIGLKPSAKTVLIVLLGNFALWSIIGLIALFASLF